MIKKSMNIMNMMKMKNMSILIMNIMTSIMRMTNITNITIIITIIMMKERLRNMVFQLLYIHLESLLMKLNLMNLLKIYQKM